ncbi:MAG TPA: lipid A deacylase LpxR family protein [Sulfuricella sp.]|nr:lipid A deacylase LpxR family protein [Sulfuricella sp.]
MQQALPTHAVEYEVFRAIHDTHFVAFQTPGQLSGHSSGTGAIPGAGRERRAQPVCGQSARHHGARTAPRALQLLLRKRSVQRHRQRLHQWREVFLGLGQPQGLHPRPLPAALDQAAEPALRKPASGQIHLAQHGGHGRAVDVHPARPQPYRPHSRRPPLCRLALPGARLQRPRCTANGHRRGQPRRGRTGRTLARQTQNFVHDLRGIPSFKGWSNQLNNELGFQLVAERKNRVWNESRPGLQFDAITHYGASLGNIRTYLNTGLELRAGNRIPNDFGTSPIRPAGDSNAPLEGPVARRFADGGLHAFISADVRAVAHDIFLDGNTFSDSHRVDKKHFVGDLASGIAWQWQGGKITYARYVRSKEFETQENAHVFGSITLSLEY